MTTSMDPTRIDMDVDPNTRRMKGYAYHGNTPFDVPFISHIDGNLWVGGCEDGLVLPTNIEHLISLYPWEAYTVNHELKSVMAYRLYDADVDNTMFEGLIPWATACVKDAPTLIHCQAGLNRSNFVAAQVLMHLGRTAREAIDLLRDKRSPAVLCNRSFETYLIYGDIV